MSASTTWDGQPIAPEPPYGASVVVYRTTLAGPQFLILHRAHEGPEYEGEWAWTPPSGARLPGETIEACAQRELYEEAGLRASIFPVSQDDWPTGGPDGGVAPDDARRHDVLRGLAPDWAVFYAEVAPEAVVMLHDAEHDRFE